MELIPQPNRWSCNACAWAMVLGLTLEELVHIFVPGGSIRIDEDALDDEELTWIAVKSGWACTVLDIDRPWLFEDLIRFLPSRQGVLSVTHPEIPDGLHAVAWDGMLVYDPLLGHRPLSEYELHGFIWLEQVRREVA